MSHRPEDASPLRLICPSVLCALSISPECTRLRFELVSLKGAWLIALEQRDSGVLLPVRAQPGAKLNGVTGEHAGQLKVSVTQAPEKGKANAAIIEVLADRLNLKRSQISLVTGETSGQKKFLVTGISLADLQARITAEL